MPSQDYCHRLLNPVAWTLGQLLVHQPKQVTVFCYRLIALRVLIWSLLMIVSSSLASLHPYLIPLYWRLLLSDIWVAICSPYFITSENQSVYHWLYSIPPPNLILNGWCTDSVLKLRKYNTFNLQNVPCFFPFPFFSSCCSHCLNTSCIPFPLLTPFHFPGFSLIVYSLKRSFLMWSKSGWADFARFILFTLIYPASFPYWLSKWPKYIIEQNQE